MTDSRAYPRSLYLHGWADLSAEKIVHDQAEENSARADGYKTLPEFPHPDDFPNGVVTVSVPAAPPVPTEPVVAPSEVNDDARENMAAARPVHRRRGSK